MVFSSTLLNTEPLARIAGKPVRLRFAMKDADLYSLRFKYGQSRQLVRSGVFSAEIKK